MVPCSNCFAIAMATSFQRTSASPLLARSPGTERSRAAKKEHEQRRRRKRSPVSANHRRGWRDLAGDLEGPRESSRATTLDDNRAICGAVERLLAEECREYRYERAEEQMAEVRRMRTGIEREPATTGSHGVWA